jgi:hypothetical protein
LIAGDDPNGLQASSVLSDEPLIPSSLKEFRGAFTYALAFFCRNFDCYVRNLAPAAVMDCDPTLGSAVRSV